MSIFPRFIFFLACVLDPGSLVAQAHAIPTISRNPEDYFRSVIAVRVEPAEVEAPTEQARRRFHRAVVIRAEIYTTLFIEQVTQGSDGCCMEFAWARQLVMFELASAFGLRGEMSDLVLGDWRSPRSFEFTLHRRRFLATIGEGTDLLVDELDN